MSLIKAIFLASLLLAPLFSSGQKVAVVLSGGGAKGLAHVGVLKALEENDIPIDYIVGTSMGGIVAACYAAGYSTTEIEMMMLSEDFQRWVNGELEKGYNYYYSKDTDHPSFLSLQLSLDSTLNATIASSLASDLSLNFALLERFGQASANARYNFDSLLIPTRIMAADIFTQNEIAIDSGSLGSAVRATLSVPFFYKPIKFNDKYLFDGGIYNNFPVDVAQREFNPDVIIGVNVSSKIFNDYPKFQDDELLNRSLLFMLLDKSNPESIPDSGVYLEPNLDGYTSFDFGKVKSLIDSGYIAANRSMDEIKSKVSKRLSCDDITARRNTFHAKNRPFVFTDIKFNGFNSKQRKFIKHIFRYKEGKKLYFNDIKKGYFRLVSEQYFNTIYPSMQFDENTKSYQLTINGRPESNLNIEMGGAIATRNISQIFLGVRHYYFNNFLLKNSFNFYAGSFYKSAQLKSKLNFPALGQFYLEADLIYNHWDFLEEEDIFTTENKPTFLTRTDRKYGLNLGFPVGTKFKAVANAAWINNADEFTNTAGFSSGDTLDRIELSGLRAGIHFSRNNLNRKQYASEGSAFKLSLDYFDINERYEPGSTSTSSQIISSERQWIRAKGTIEQYFNSGKYSTGYYFQGHFSNQPFFANYTATLLNSPGFTAMQDSETRFLQKFQAHNYLTFGLRNVITISKNLDFRLEGYAFKAIEAIEQRSDQSAFYNDDLSKIFLAGTSSIVFHSPVGPVSINVNYYDDPENQWSLLMHVGYLLFQPRSLE